MRVKCLEFELLKSYFSPFETILLLLSTKVLLFETNYKLFETNVQSILWFLFYFCLNRKSEKQCGLIFQIAIC